MNWQEMIRGNNLIHAGLGLDIKMNYLNRLEQVQHNLLIYQNIV